ncbi:MAG: AbrB/MazE/SpoVT family DNA-binding domain-containing protein [Candidatus Verstraetearchaeota archaeon]|nr:AbrB/MazE/SpoVT family DNA-binding domain-containing protein [Candidatus Verstraetearchaeota archaeon]
MAETYVCKVTSVGQITLPKEVREELEVGEEDFIVLEKVGQTYFLRKVGVDKALLKRVRERVRKSGITKERLSEIVEEVSEDAWRKTYEGVR